MKRPSICLGILLVLMSCGRQESAGTAPVIIGERMENTPADRYDLEGIKSLTAKNVLTTEEQDFIIDQYEIFCRETCGMDSTAVSKYLKGLGFEAHPIMYVIKDIETCRTFNDAQMDRLEDIKRKYRLNQPT